MTGHARRVDGAIIPLAQTKSTASCTVVWAKIQATMTFIYVAEQCPNDAKVIDFDDFCLTVTNTDGSWVDIALHLLYN